MPHFDQDARDEIIEKLDALEARIRKLEDAFNLGKGAAWALTKLGLILAAVMGLGAALWEAYRS